MLEKPPTGIIKTHTYNTNTAKERPQFVYAFIKELRCYSELDINIKKYNIIALRSFVHITWEYVHTLVVVPLSFSHLSLFVFASDYAGSSKTFEIFANE